MPNYEDNRFTPRVVPGSALSAPEGVNIMPSGTRAGNADRDRAINHIAQMAEQGYITPDEADKRVKHAENLENIATLRVLTSDLPAPLDTRAWWESYNWDNMRHWVPTLIGGMTLSAVTVVVPTSVLNAEHLFPNTPLGLGIGIFTLIVGVIGFFACLAGIIVKSKA
jgi:hypothetical protein